MPHSLTRFLPRHSGEAILASLPANRNPVQDTSHAPFARHGLWPWGRDIRMRFWWKSYIFIPAPTSSTHSYSHPEKGISSPPPPLMEWIECAEYGIVGCWLELTLSQIGWTSSATWNGCQSPGGCMRFPPNITNTWFLMQITLGLIYRKCDLDRLL